MSDTRGFQQRDQTPEQSPASLVAAAAAGSRRAWEDLVESFAPTVWGTARGHDLDPGEAATVSRATWMRLFDHLNRVQEPERVGAWLAETAGRESLRVLQLRGHSAPG